MGKQTFGSIKNALAILLVVLFVLSVTSAAITAKTDINNSMQKNLTNNTTATKTTLVGNNTTTALYCPAENDNCVFIMYDNDNKTGNNTTLVIG